MFNAQRPFGACGTDEGLVSCCTGHEMNAWQREKQQSVVFPTGKVA